MPKVIKLLFTLVFHADQAFPPVGSSALPYEKPSYNSKLNKICIICNHKASLFWLLRRQLLRLSNSKEKSKALQEIGKLANQATTPASGKHFDEYDQLQEKFRSLFPAEFAEAAFKLRTKLLVHNGLPRLSWRSATALEPGRARRHQQ
ncbi:hypothetical protein TNIN_173801 [Trichonephila inaurata madagascariensis]|uniref:Uncharacterized protein n=1 Tax=Trichonephila inaurata madagascariensis TaxID=2747483 RepID=A0A8X6IWV3_9ARAC|nr:hypothetical protein TNIN_173801 [Trichonephila inaurata madagascariensis]